MYFRDDKNWFDQTVYPNVLSYFFAEINEDFNTCFMLLFNYLDTLPKLYFASVTTMQVNNVLSYSSMNVMPMWFM